MVSENGATPSVPEPPLSAPARMCRAMPVASSGPWSVSRTANSSPPIRNPRSGRRRLPWMIRAVARRSSSPPACPWTSLVFLRSSRSTSSRATEPDSARTLRDLAIELLLERAVVAEPGQPVAQHLQACAVVGILESVPRDVVVTLSRCGPPEAHPGQDAERHHEWQQRDRRPAQVRAGRSRDQQRRADPQQNARAEPAHQDGATAARSPRLFCLHRLWAIQSWRSPRRRSPRCTPAPAIRLRYGGTGGSGSWRPGGRSG